MTRINSLIAASMAVSKAIVSTAIAQASPVNAAAASPAAASAPRPPHLKIDLDAFDASKKSVLLPNGESLAYVDRGEKSGSALSAASTLNISVKESPSAICVRSSSAVKVVA